jgi:hypothetical protein
MESIKRCARSDLCARASSSRGPILGSRGIGAPPNTHKHPHTQTYTQEAPPARRTFACAHARCASAASRCARCAASASADCSSCSDSTSRSEDSARDSSSIAARGEIGSRTQATRDVGYPTGSIAETHTPRSSAACSRASLAAARSCAAARVNDTPGTRVRGAAPNLPRCRGGARLVQRCLERGAARLQVLVPGHAYEECA